MKQNLYEDELKEWLTDERYWKLARLCDWDEFKATIINKSIDDREVFEMVLDALSIGTMIEILKEKEQIFDIKCTTDEYGRDYYIVESPNYSGATGGRHIHEESHELCDCFFAAIKAIL